MRKIFKQLWRDQRGTTPLEYSLLAMIVTVVLVSGLYGRGESLAAIFADITHVTETARQNVDVATSCSGAIDVGNLHSAEDSERG